MAEAIAVVSFTFADYASDFGNEVAFLPHQKCRSAETSDGD